MRIRQLLEKVIMLARKDAAKRREEELIEVAYEYADTVDKLISKMEELANRNTLALEHISMALERIAKAQEQK